DAPTWPRSGSPRSSWWARRTLSLPPRRPRTWPMPLRARDSKSYPLPATSLLTRTTPWPMPSSYDSSTGFDRAAVGRKSPRGHAACSASAYLEGRFMTASAGASLIITTPQLLALVEHVRAMARFAFDTEVVLEDTFEPVLWLIQVATRERLALIDPLAVRDLDPFWDVVCDPAIEVVMHAAGEDLRICLIKSGRLPRRVYDVQLAAGLAGFSYPLSLVNLVGQVLGVSLSGGETRTDWRRRPLSSGQVEYALDDVRYLLDLADFFGTSLKD